MRVVHIISGLGTGGAEMMLYKLLAGSDVARFSQSVIVLRGGGPIQSEIEKLGIPVFDLNANPSISSLIRLARCLRQIRPDVIQGWMVQGNLTACLSRLFVSSHVPILWNVRHASVSAKDIGIKSLTLTKALSLVSWLPSHIIYNSQCGAEFHHSIGYHPNKTLVIPNCFDTERYTSSQHDYLSVRDELGVSSKSILIGLFARYHPIKDHETFLVAAAKLASIDPNVQFLLVGTNVNNDNPTLVRLVASLGLSGRVYMMGERRDIPRLTSALDIATLSSVSEGFPNVLGEAMSCEIPCVATDVGDCAAIIGDTGRTVPSRNSDALLSAWQELLSMSLEERQALGRQARERVLRHFSFNRIVQAYANTYESAVNDAT